MIHDVDQLVPEEPGIDGVQDGSQPGHPVETLDVAIGTASERGHAVAGAHPEPPERRSQPARTLLHFEIVRSMQRTCRTARYDLAPGMLLRRVPDEP